MKDATVEGLLKVIYTGSFDLPEFRGDLQQARDCWGLAQRKREHMIVSNGLEKRTLNKCVGEVRGDAMDYMQDVREVVQEQVRLAPGLNNVMFPTDVGKKNIWLETDAMRLMYFWEVYSALREVGT